MIRKIIWNKFLAYFSQHDKNYLNVIFSFLNKPSNNMSNSDNNPCFECGQCCRSLRVSFYQGEVIHEDNQGRIGTVPQGMVTQLTPHLVCMKGTEVGKQPCVALRHDPQSGYRCSIYESRPSPCREFNIFNEDGSLNPLCDRLRHQIGLPSVTAT